MLVLHESGPHGQTVAGTVTDSPTFALYDDGLVIYAAGDGDSARLVQAQLSPDAVHAMVERAHERLDGVPDQVELATASDQPTVSIHVATRGPTRDVFAYGLGRDAERTDAAPSSLWTLYGELVAYAHDEAEPWQPDELEVFMAEVTHAETPAHSWPTTLPPPPAGITPLPGPEYAKGKFASDRILYRIDGGLEDDVTRALEGLDGAPIEHDGTTWHVHVRRVIPG